MEDFQDGVMHSGGEDGCVEDAVYSGAAAVNVALATELTAIAIHRSDAGRGSRLSIAQDAELRLQGRAE